MASSAMVPPEVWGQTLRFWRGRQARAATCPLPLPLPLPISPPVNGLITIHRGRKLAQFDRSLKAPGGRSQRGGQAGCLLAGLRLPGVPAPSLLLEHGLFRH